MPTALNHTSKSTEESWPLSGVKAGEILQESGGRLVFEISAREGCFVCKVADQSTPKEDLIRDTFAFDFLKSNGFSHIPTLLRTSEGDAFLRINGAYTYVMEHVEGRNDTRRPQDWGTLAQIAAKLHDVPDYPYESLFTIEDELQKLESRSRALPFHKELMEIARQLPDFAGVSQSVIHSDLSLANAIRKPDGSMVLIDWDDAGLGPTILDLGFPLLCYFVCSEDLNFERGRARAFFGTYFSRRSLPARDRALIFDVGIFYLLIYCTFGDAERKWQRLRYALNNRELVESVVHENEIPSRIEEEFIDLAKP